EGDGGQRGELLQQDLEIGFGHGDAQHKQRTSVTEFALLLVRAPAALDPARSGTKAVELEAVADEAEAEATGDSLLLVLDVVVLELEHVLAFDADQVVVVLGVAGG